MGNPFKSRVRCKKCGKNYMRKKEKGVNKLLCSGYHNKNGCTERVIIEESLIRELINKRYDKEMSDSEISDVLDYIIIKNKYLMEIHFSDGSEPILLITLLLILI